MGKHAALDNAHIQINAWVMYYHDHANPDGEGHPTSTPLGQAINGAPGVQLCKYLTCQSREPVGCDKAIKPPEIRRMDRIVDTLPHHMNVALGYRYLEAGVMGKRTKAYIAATGNSSKTHYNYCDQGLAWVAAALAHSKVA